MTTSSKLTYLNTTKQLLKTEINKINNVLDDNSTFRSYPQELFNGYLDVLNNGTDTLWNNLEKVSASGEEATLENVETAPMKIELNGNTSQDTTSGKNLIKIVGLSSKEEKTKTVNDVTFTVNDDGTVKVEGTNSGSSRILQAVTYESAVTGEAGTYYYFTNSPSQPKRLEMACFVDEKYEYPNSYGTTPWSKTATTNFTIRNIYFIINAGETVNNVYYAILTRNVDPQPYEPYTGGQPSPSPDYPQQVKVVTGENVVSVSGKNLFDKSSNIVLNKYIGEDGAISGNSPRNWYQEDYIEVSNSTDYIISTTSSNYVRVAFYDDSKNFISRIVANGGIQISTTSSTKYLRLSGYDNQNDNIQLELGSTATPYVPYSKTDYPINLGDIELCKINTHKGFPFKAINGNEYYDTLTDEQKNALNYGSWYVHKAIGKKVVTSSEILGQTDSYSNVIYYKFNKNTDSINYNNYNSMVAFYTHAKISNSFNFDSLSQVSTINSLAENTRYWVGFPKGTTLAQAKEKLVGSVLYYILKTPTEEEITNTTLIEQLEAISKAKSVKDKTYITQTNDELPFILDVEAIKEYEVN